MSSLDRLLVQRLTVVRAGESTDRYGNTTRSWDSATRHEVDAWCEQMTSDESNDGRAELFSDWLAVLPLGADIRGRDRVEFDGMTFEVNGPPTTRHTPRGPHHIEATLRWIEG